MDDQGWIPGMIGVLLTSTASQPLLSVIEPSIKSAPRFPWGEKRHRRKDDHSPHAVERAWSCAFIPPPPPLIRLHGLSTGIRLHAVMIKQRDNFTLLYFSFSVSTAHLQGEWKETTWGELIVVFIISRTSLATDQRYKKFTAGVSYSR